MPIINNTSQLDETSYQYNFYNKFCLKDVTIARNTDGYQDGTIFEHKTNVMSYGISRTLSQALIYLVRFNQDGLPVPKNICLVSQNEEKVYIFDSNDFLDIINDIPTYSNMSASTGIKNFTTTIKPIEIEYKFSGDLKDNKKIIDFLSQEPEYVSLCFENKCRSFEYNNVIIKNELCFDSNTLAKNKLSLLIGQSPLTNEEIELIKGFDAILNYCKKLTEYNLNFNYGLRQIDEEINVKIVETLPSGVEKTVPKYGDLNIMIKNYKRNLSDYYENSIVPLLFKYELLK